MRRRILTATFVVAALAIAAFAIPLAIVLPRRQADQDRRKLIELAVAVLRDVPDNFATDPERATVTQVDDIRHIGVYRPDGRLVLGIGPTLADSATRRAFSNEVADDRMGKELVVAIPVSDGERVIGAIRVSEPIGLGADRVHRLWYALVGLAVAALSAAGVAAVVQSRRLSRPLEHVREAAVALGDGDFTISLAASDVAEIDDIARALTVTAQRLGTALERERSFSADASHQLRTPVAALRLVLETELAAPRLSPQLALLDALGNVERLESTIEQLLALARDIEHAERTPLDVHRLGVDLQKRWIDPLAASRRRLDITIADDLPRVRASPAAVLHALDVLVDNAYRHGLGDVAVHARATTGGLAIDVSDQGPGVANPAEIFRRRNASARGTGIGLALARALIEAEGGRLELTTARPHATLTVHLPEVTDSDGSPRLP